MKFHILALILGILLDLAFGDPRFLYHPIRLIGNLIAWAEKPFRSVFPKSERGELIAGVFFAVFVIERSSCSVRRNCNSLKLRELICAIW